ncbi:MAG: hypothetical protein WEA31_02685 [Pirellulales bacterium]
MIVPQPKQPVIAAQPKQPVIDRRASVSVPLEPLEEVSWGLTQNFAVGVWDESGGRHRMVPAVDVSELDPSQRQDARGIAPEDTKRHSPFAVWSKQFDVDAGSPYHHGWASVVDEQVFTDLRIVSAGDAVNLKLDGSVIGRIKSEDYDPAELARFLLVSGIIDANHHILATVTGSQFTSDEGHWFKLHGSDPYWTSKYNHANYYFGIHIAKDGTIRLINRRYVGRMLAE